MVQSNTIVLPGSDAGVIRLKGTPLALAMSLDGNGRYAYLDPYLGGALAVAESCRNVSAAGATPIGGHQLPQLRKPGKARGHVAVRSRRRRHRRCLHRTRDSHHRGNVSFYNETEGESIYPTPVVGTVGILEDKTCRVSHHFKGRGDWIYLAGLTTDELGGSEYLKTIHGRIEGLPPRLDLDQEKAVQAFIRDAAARKRLRSAHDLSEGGLAVALAESLFGPLGETVGATVSLECPGRVDSMLFSEGTSRILLSVAKEHAEELEALAGNQRVALSSSGNHRRGSTPRPKSTEWMPCHSSFPNSGTGGGLP